MKNIKGAFSFFFPFCFLPLRDNVFETKIKLIGTFIILQKGMDHDIIVGEKVSCHE